MTTPIDRIRPAVSAPRTVGDAAARFGLAPVRGTGSGADLREVEVSSVASDDRTVAEGDLFVALPGARAHGATFAARAVERGARAVLTDAEGSRLLDGCPVPVLVADDPRALLGPLAAWVYHQPAERLATFGVTGTNGKTTTTYLLDHALRSLGWTGGLIGTVEMRSGDRVLPSRLTTPEAADLQALLAAMREDGVHTLAMEVSSHALALHRVDGLVFDVVGFTNLSQDHLDFHGDLHAYFDAKAQLFTPAHARRGVVVVDDPWGERMVEAARVPVATLRVRPDVAGDPAGARPEADWTVTDTDVAPDGGTGFVVRHRDGRSVRTATALPGPFNLANAALAVVMVLEGGTDPRDLEASLAATGGLAPAVPGRMEVVSEPPHAPRVVVDFAHNPDALALALDALRPTTPGRLVVVFGATGDRDRGKRPTMGAVAVDGADVVVVTDDDPHGEDPAAIRAEVLPGALAARDAAAAGPEARDVVVREVAPRARAIHEAVAAAGPLDTVLVAGRGHEVWQEIAGVDHPLDDRVEARAALAARGAPQDTQAGTPAHDEKEHHA
ncbi:UDP-N-acetylmuramoyl-L-alanyl-D-glutamate--2,6-diaminopimelate ligase [Cellulosimicrobium marinum]|uniref:UDP-N-acetylmuramoyl-L-alanyl-D-glutamate--2, 6-diaminopimelate ligase n=1 Tax=Cellulosimicrobium marinum TaxID=1638992 RepID=UPI001E38BD26|nr:UDP-N-acetylmuramoyl-L-alanyl-D-glutamate--2,6-diaminopimelate ligase [Cellulosimicrobium marinum]MCB7137780.1 UDP-N-acetylmuramoyl-L-alanyl-D-glutamate--2,6-diaminopimelate ligase [Cellulosimicrobium marinum]